MAKVNTEQAEDDNDKTMRAEFGMPIEATISSSKRKRSQPGLVYAAYVSEPSQEREHTPKRSRTGDWPVSERGGSSGRGDGPDIKQRSVRRKDGKYGLSSLSRRHAQESADSAERASKFLEGSMNDRPSAMPPSLFTRDISEHSLAASAYSANVDHLMADYHNDQTPRQSVEAQYPHASQMTQAYAALEKLSVESPEHTKPSGLFRFGRMVASSFNPANVWGSFSRTFKDTKDEMTFRNIEENRKKAILHQQKVEAEAKYAEMKAAGLFARSPFTVLHTGQPDARQPDQDDLPPLQHLVHTGQSSFTPVGSDEGRHQYFAPQPQPSAAVDEEEGEGEGEEEEEEDDGDILRPVAQYPATTDQRHSNHLHGHTPDPQKTIKPRKSLFSIIHRPSFSTLKRPRSDFNLVANLSTTDTTSARPISASQSPDKRDKAQQHNEVSTLKHSMSKRDLGKQQKLSKRVSDLESKLAEARRELTSAINNASPLPELPSRFEKFTPSKHTPTGSITARFRSKFIAGKLPSLPSERLLFPEQPAEAHHDDTTNLATPAPAPRSSSNMNQDTPLPALPDTMTEPPTTANQKPLPETPIIEEESFVEADRQESVEEQSFAEADMQEPDDIVDDDTIYVAHAKESYEDLDAQLKAVEQRAAEGKTRKRGGAKKRKSTDDMEYRPGSREDDDDDYGEFPFNRKSKKRKSLSNKSSKDGFLTANTGKKKTSAIAYSLTAGN
ncbi:hypothetical protein BDV97DRAFT_117676 [Delphinella strobiligena]|nr:hypothetical protein BDV97DRAFT_117676 [Delphinella strobiligena]